MLPFNPGGHAAYQDFIFNQLRKYYPNTDSLPRDTWEIIEHFYQKDLSQVDVMLKDCYSVFGPAPRLPSCMLRSYLLSLKFKVTSYTEWAKQLKVNPLYAILSGFEFGDTPGIGTFADFFSRLWDSEDDNFSEHIHELKPSVKKPSKRGQKVQPIVKTKIEELLKQLAKLENSGTCPHGRPICVSITEHELERRFKRCL